MLVGLKLDGKLAGAKVLSHQEPIIGMYTPEGKLILPKFTDQYKDLDIRIPTKVNLLRTEGPGSIDGISSATVSAVLFNGAILRAARIVAISKGLRLNDKSVVDIINYKKQLFNDLIEDGSISRLTLKKEDLKNMGLSKPKVTNRSGVADIYRYKSVFKGKDITDNLQDLIYTLAVKKLFPNFKKRQVEFLFLKFDLNSTGTIKMKDISPEELEGLELQLTSIQNYLDNFSEEDASSNFAADQGYPKDGTFGGPLMCGKDGYKISKGQTLLDKEGNPVVAYICPYRKPIDYIVLKDCLGDIKRSFFKDDPELDTLVLEEGESLCESHYDGCPRWNKDTSEIDDFL